jgi:hypothetical protein
LTPSFSSCNPKSSRRMSGVRHLYSKMASLSLAPHHVKGGDKHLLPRSSLRGASWLALRKNFRLDASLSLKPKCGCSRRRKLCDDRDVWALPIAVGVLTACLGVCLLRECCWECFLLEGLDQVTTACSSSSGISYSYRHYQRTLEIAFLRDCWCRPRFRAYPSS